MTNTIQYSLCSTAKPVLIEHVQFSIAREVFDEAFPRAFTVSNPSPRFTINGKPYVLTSADLIGSEVRCGAQESPEPNYAWAESSD